MPYMVVEGLANQVTQMRRGVIAYCVLALVREGDHYGFDLVRQLSDADSLVTSEGTIYPLLTRLRREGLVESFWQDSPHGPPRRYYRITDDGRAVLEAFSAQWKRFTTTVDFIIEGGST